ncbi:MAG: hypothetical protein LCH88_08985 [Proteobacteria bacterium]|nr:hypothetical protein [Pseudomonadota bacterium]
MADYEQNAWARSVDAFERNKAMYQSATTDPRLKDSIWRTMKFWQSRFPRHLIMPERTHD